MKDRLKVCRSIRMRIVAALACSAAASACGEPPVQVDRDPPPVEVRSRLGDLEQVLTVRLVTGVASNRELQISSRIVNRGSSSQPVTLRVCLFQPGDVQSNADLVYYEPLISCGAVESTTSLPAGQASESLEGVFAVRAGAGTYQVSVRHALQPTLRASAVFTVP